MIKSPTLKTHFKTLASHHEKMQFWELNFDEFQEALKDLKHLKHLKHLNVTRLQAWIS